MYILIYIIYKDSYDKTVVYAYATPADFPRKMLFSDTMLRIHIFMDTV